MTRVGRRGLILGPVTIKDGPSGPVNTVAPAIPASAVIGTQLVTTPGTWDGVYTLTYQWQRNTGTWSNISGATSANYTPVDADFGRALRVVETADGAVSANSNDTGLTAEAPVQSLGAELVTNGGFDVDANWVKGAGWSIGSGVATATGGISTALYQTGVGTLESYFETAFLISGYASGAVNNIVGWASLASSRSGNGTNTNVMRCAGDTSLSFVGVAFTGNIDNASTKRITLNAGLTAPSANMRITQFYTLPESPVSGDQVWLMPRISDFATGNYWLAWLRYTGARWDINLYSVATHTRTSRIAATNIGATNGMRINANGDSWSLFTTTDGGDNWTQRGSTITNATFNTATGLNVLYTSSVTAGNLLYAPAT